MVKAAKSFVDWVAVNESNDSNIWTMAEFEMSSAIGHLLQTATELCCRIRHPGQASLFAITNSAYFTYFWLFPFSIHVFVF
jgi:hypothetical protein